MVNDQPREDPPEEYKPWHGSPEQMQALIHTFMESMERAIAGFVEIIEAFDTNLTEAFKDLSELLQTVEQIEQPQEEEQHGI